jgi:hypothetical protein
MWPFKSKVDSALEGDCYIRGICGAKPGVEWIDNLCDKNFYKLPPGVCCRLDLMAHKAAKGIPSPFETPPWKTKIMQRIWAKNGAMPPST